ncbi:MAG: ferrous iron transporter B [Steroidobacteraceae bacterium]
MTTAVTRPPLIALAGNPNCGKTALFNLLTGSHQKVANYAGVTVERKEGWLGLADGRRVRVLDLPGTYSLEPRTPDEEVATAVLHGNAVGEERPDLVVCVADATNLRRSLRFVLGVRRLGLPTVVALNMSDLARRQGVPLHVSELGRELGLPVVETVGVRGDGAAPLVDLLARQIEALPARPASPTSPAPAGDASEADHAEVRRVLGAIGADTVHLETASDRIDRVLLHPVAGLVLLALVMFTVFQAVFAWAAPLMDAIDTGIGALGTAVTAALPDGALRSLLVDGVIAGAGSVLVFLPQIVILFAFILLLEDSGYLPRAAFLLDRLMGSVGLSGRSFIPLLSSFACAIPGIMATRTIANPRDRLVTILVAPLMTCSARLPVYALLIGAFIPRRAVAGVLELQGIVLFGLYLAGVLSAMVVAYIMKRMAHVQGPEPLLLELPAYHWPSLRNLAIGLWQRAVIFLQRVGTIILALMVILWALASWPSPPAGATEPAITYSVAGMLGRALAVVFEPIGFNWQIAIALVPGLAAREVAVGALGTVYALSSSNDTVAATLSPIIAAGWPLPTALALLAWYVFAPQCVATLAAVRRETGGWKVPVGMAAYLFALAYVAAGLTYHGARLLMGTS